MLDASKMAMGGVMATDIMREVYTACERMGADIDLLCLLGGYGDTLEDHDILSMLKDYNATGTIYAHVEQDINGRRDMKQ